MSKEISLAREYPKEHGGVLAVASSERGPDYPSFHYAGMKDLDLPEEGEMTIKFRKKREASEPGKNGGEHFYECDIEVQSICDVDGKDSDDDDDVQPPARGSDKGVSDILDALMEKHMDGKKDY